jgi:hypothetical protein
MEEADTWDHIVPRSLGGIGEVENLVPCCKPCNSRKCAKPLYKFRQYLKKKGMPCDFDTPDPKPIFGHRILKKDCYFESLDGSVKIDQMEFYNRVYVNET